MRSSLLAALLFFAALPLANGFAQHGHLHHHHHSSASACGCATPAPAPCATNSCNSCDSCSNNTCGACGVAGCGVSGCGGVGCGAFGCGGSGCGGSLCSNPALFYEVLYSEFYARNPWYLEHKQRESAARRARMLGQDPDAPAPAKVLEPKTK